MNEMNFAQIFDMINIGSVVLDKDFNVCHWNHWMETHSGITEDRILGTSILEAFPNLNFQGFKRNFKSVFSFGNLSFFSQKLHHYLFPFRPISSFHTGFEYMQQSCTMGPMREDNNGHVSSSPVQHVYIIVQDVTELVAYERKLLEMNMKDGLTGVFNRRFIDGRLRDEFSRHKRYSRSMSLIMFDIDFFKKINDTYGHQCGDFVLTELSSRITDVIRNVDLLARYGGEEFCCLLPETCINSAVILAERFREVVSNDNFKFGDHSLKVTISLGVSEIRECIDSPDVLLKKADEALYKAKANGRNRVMLMN